MLLFTIQMTEVTSAVKEDTSSMGLGDQMQAYKDLYHEEKQKLQVVETEAQQFKHLLHKQDIKLKTLQESCISLRSRVKQKTAELRSATSTVLYQRTQRRKKYFNERTTQLQLQIKQLHPSKIKQLRHNFRNNQKRLSQQKRLTDLHREESKINKEELKISANRNQELEAELLYMKDTAKLTTRYDNNQFTMEVEKCVMQLATECEVSAQKCGRVIQAVSKNIFNVDIMEKDLPSENTVINMVDRAHVLAKYQVAEEMSESEQWDYHFDGTTRDNKKILGQQVTLSTGKNLSVGFVGMVEEDSTTLVENAMDMITELADLYDGKERETLIKEFLTKMCATMSDRASVNKCFGRKFAVIRKEQLQDDEVETHMLFCNAHFLLGLSNESEKLLKGIEKTIEASRGEKLGRNSSAKFSHFGGGGESGTGRYIRTASDVFGPRGDEKNGCRSDWIAFCVGVQHVKSRVSSFRMNRFNNFFACAAALYFHQHHVEEFLTTYKYNLNLKLESVKLDCLSDEIQALIRALAILYFKVTGPYWSMLHADIEYVDLYVYVQRMLHSLTLWQQDVSQLMDANSPCVFPEFFPESTRDSMVYDKVFSVSSEGDQQETELALKKLVEGFVVVVQRQLSDFLPGGEYGEEPSIERRMKLKHSKLTNLLGENAFGDLDFSQFKRRNASMHYHSGIHMVKTNKTISKWLTNKTHDEQAKLLQIAHQNSVNLRRKHRQHESNIVIKRKEKLELNKRIMEEKLAAKQATREKLLADIKHDGGPCQCAADVDNLDLGNLTKAAQIKALKLQMQYQKEILGRKDKLLLVTGKSPQDLCDNLKLFLGGNQPCDLQLQEVDHQCTEEDLLECQEVEEQDFEIVTKVVFGGFNFQLQGEYIAVAYEEDFHVGMVTSVQNDNLATVQWLRKGYKTSFKWPAALLIADVESRFVLCGDIELTTPNNGRTWSVTNLEKIQKLYHCYCEQYFM